jgi:GH25 family lysozyme M1 (1,4-beta-N-acetylmuramidase)
MNEVFGIDVSHHNGRIDWEQVAHDNKKFAIMKCQYEAQSHRIDEYFEYNYEQAGKFGIARGVYIYIARASMADPKADAESLLRHLNGRPLEYGIWLDLEDKTVDVKGKAYIRDLAFTYADIFMKAGYYVGIYCNRDWYIRLIHQDLKDSFDFWIARYPSHDTGVYNKNSSLKPNASMAVAWQYSSKGNVAGIQTRCDLSVDYDGIIKLIAATPKRKSYDEIAREVWENKWGTKDTNPTRNELLERAGYDPKLVQAKVNELKANYML